VFWSFHALAGSDVVCRAVTEIRFAPVFVVSLPRIRAKVAVPTLPGVFRHVRPNVTCSVVPPFASSTVVLCLQARPALKRLLWPGMVTPCCPVRKSAYNRVFYCSRERTRRMPPAVNFFPRKKKFNQKSRVFIGIRAKGSTSGKPDRGNGHWD